MRTLGTLATALLLLLPLAAADDLVQATVTVTAEVTAHPDEAMAYVPDPTQDGLSGSSIRIAGDLAGAELSGSVLLSGTAKAARGYVLRHVDVWVDDGYAGRAQGTESWTFTLDTTLLADGPHRVQVTSFALPRLTPVFILTGSSAEVRVLTLNHQPGVVLFERTMDFTGAGADAWLVRLHQDYTGLRVSLTTEALPGGSLPAPEAQLLVAYKQTADGDAPTLRTWTATYGRAHGVVSVAPHPVLRAPGVLTLDGVVAGEGRVHIKVEAVPRAG